jgi:hypothetical protein
VGSALVNLIREGIGARQGIGPALALRVAELRAGTERP